MSLHSAYNSISVRAIILAGNRDFGRCPLASKVPLALWPVGEKPALLHLLDNIQKEGINSAVICSNGQRELLQKAAADVHSPKIEFLEEPLPLGTAGCIRDAVSNASEELFLILSGQMFLLPNLKELIIAHRTSKAALTIVSNSENNSTCELYLCNRSVLEQIPPKGYFDIKESLIPALLKAGKIIRAINIPEKIPGIFRNRPEYLKIMEKYMINCMEHLVYSSVDKGKLSENTWISDSARIENSVIIHKPAVILKNSVISANAIIFGPAIIGPDAVIDSSAIIQNSVLWNNVHIGKNCNIVNCVLDNNIKVSNGRVIENQAVVQNLYHYMRNIKYTVSSLVTQNFFNV